jgi:hypothetical protein
MRASIKGARLCDATALCWMRGSLSSMLKPILKVEEIPFDHPDSHYMFQPGPEKPFLATPAAIALYRDAIYRCLTELQRLAGQKQGLDYLQVFEDPDKAEPLWFIEDDAGGAITALLPSDH